VACFTLGRRDLLHHPGVCRTQAGGRTEHAMMRASIVIGALAVAATAASAPQAVSALAVRGGQTELINRPGATLQPCLSGGKHTHWQDCDGSYGMN
jgi:hypothetical protein